MKQLTRSLIIAEMRALNERMRTSWLRNDWQGVDTLKDVDKTTLQIERLVLFAVRVPRKAKK